MKRLASLAAFVVLVFGCGPSLPTSRPSPDPLATATPTPMPTASPVPEPATTPTALPFRTVFQSRHFTHQGDHPEVFVFRSAADVASFAKDHPEAEALPELDFQQEMGVLVLFGHQVVWNLGQVVGIDDPGASLTARLVRWGPKPDVDAVGDPAAYVALAPVQKPVVLAPAQDRNEADRSAWQGLVQGSPAVRVGQPVLLSAVGPDVRWRLDAGSATLAPDRSTCIVTPTAPGPVRLTLTTGSETQEVVLAGVAADVPAPLPSVPLPRPEMNRLAIPPGVFVINSAAEWQALWSSAAAFYGADYASVPGTAYPDVPAVDFTRRSLVVLTDALYAPEAGPILTRLTPTLEVVKPDGGRSISHLDFNQSITLYDVPKLPQDLPVSATCPAHASCPTPSPSGF